MGRDGIGALRSRLLAIPGRRLNPEATPALREGLYWHGTQDPFAQQVLQTWTLQPRAATGVLEHKPRAWLDPLAGRVYLAQTPTHALRYLGLKRHRKSHPVGLLVEVDGRNLGEVHPDEDDVGLAAYIAGSGSYWHGGTDQAIGEAMWQQRPGDAYPKRTAFAERLLDLANRHLTRHQLEHVMGDWGDPDVSMLARVGKKLLPYLSDDDQVELMELGAAIAHVGPVPVARAWACPSSMPPRLRVEGWRAMQRQCTEVFDAADYAAARRELLERLPSPY